MQNFGQRTKGAVVVLEGPGLTPTAPWLSTEWGPEQLAAGRGCSKGVLVLCLLPGRGFPGELVVEEVPLWEVGPAQWPLSLWSRRKVFKCGSREAGVDGTRGSPGDPTFSGEGMQAHHGGRKPHVELPCGPLSSRWAPCGLGAGPGCWGKDRPSLGQTADEVAWGGVPRAGLSAAAWLGRGVGHKLGTGQAAKGPASVRWGLGTSQEGRRCCETLLGWPSPRPPHLCWGPPPHSTRPCLLDPSSPQPEEVGPASTRISQTGSLRHRGLEGLTRVTSPGRLVALDLTVLREGGRFRGPACPSVLAWMPLGPQGHPFPSPSA